MIQIINKNGATNSDDGNVIILDKNGNVRKITTATPVIWGSITGNITLQTDLVSYLSTNYYPLSSNPANYATQSFVTSQGYITNVITALGFTPENVANKVTNLNTPNNTTYPTTQAVVNKTNQLSFEEFTLRQTKNIYHFTDFLSDVRDGSWRTGNGAGASFTYTQNAPNNTTFGEIFLNTNTNATTFAQVYFGATGAGGGSLLRLGNGKFTSVFRCRLSILSDVTNSYGVAVMVNSFLNLFHNASGYYFLYDPQNNFGLGINNGNWWVRNTISGVFDTGVLATTSYVNFRIETNQNYTEVYFYINNVLVRTETNIITSLNCTPGHIGIRKFTGTNNVSLICDYMGFYYELNTLR